MHQDVFRNSTISNDTWEASNGKLVKEDVDINIDTDIRGRVSSTTKDDTNTSMEADHTPSGCISNNFFSGLCQNIYTSVGNNSI